MESTPPIDPDLSEPVLESSGEETATATVAVTVASRELVTRREPERLLDLFGTLDWDADNDYKAERSRSRRCSAE